MLAPSEQKFSLAISDDSGGNKNGAPVLTLKFGKGAASATTIVAKKGTPTIDGKDGDTYVNSKMMNWELLKKGGYRV